MELMFLRYPSLFNIKKNQTFDSVNQFNWHLINISGTILSYLIVFVGRLLIPFSLVTSILGFALMLSIVLQILTGFFLGFYYIPEPGLVIELREEMFNDTRFGLEIFIMHVRGVDLIYVLSYAHILKKIFLKNYMTTEPDGWMLGGYAFFWFHYVVFLGITLSASHLSDLTLTIAANIYWSLFYNTYKTYYLLFTNKHLNSDQLTRLMIFHYLTPWYYIYLIQMHVLFCHESWDSNSAESSYEDKSSNYVSWQKDKLPKEGSDSTLIGTVCASFFIVHYFKTHSLSYSYFERWNISELFEINFFTVAPHWYFKAFMGLLTVTPTHYEGLMWVGLYFVSLACLPLTYSFYNSTSESTKNTVAKDSNIFVFFFVLFMLSLFYTASVLPVGRYYYEAEGGYVGNFWIKCSYQYIYLYLLFILPNIDNVEALWNRWYTLMVKKLTVYFLVNGIEQQGKLVNLYYR